MMEGNHMDQRKKRNSCRAKSGAQLLSADILCIVFSFLDEFDLIRCSVVCKSWHDAIQVSSLLSIIYQKKYCHVSTSLDSSEILLKKHLAGLAMEQHRLSLSEGLVEVHQWEGHLLGVNQCRMKGGSILTGVGDKVVCIWSSRSYKCLREYSVLDANMLVDLDFDENKIVGLIGSRICIWKNLGQKSIFPSFESSSFRGLCMRYIDPEVVVGCDDGRIRVFDMYSKSCSRIMRMRFGPVSCLALNDDNLIFGGSSLGVVSINDLTSDEHIGSLKSSFTPTGITCLSTNPLSHMVFAGSSSGHILCWDVRTMKAVWEVRASPNVIYSVQHLPGDTSTLVVGGIDGVLRNFNQNTGELLSSYVIEDDAIKKRVSSRNKLGLLEKKRVKSLSEEISIDQIPKQLRPPITSVAVGMKKIITTHNKRYIRVWKFNR